MVCSMDRDCSIFKSTYFSFLDVIRYRLLEKSGERPMACQLFFSWNNVRPGAPKTFLEQLLYFPKLTFSHIWSYTALTSLKSSHSDLCYWKIRREKQEKSVKATTESIPDLVKDWSNKNQMCVFLCHNIAALLPATDISDAQWYGQCQNSYGLDVYFLTYVRLIVRTYVWSSDHEYIVFQNILRLH